MDTAALDYELPASAIAQTQMAHFAWRSRKVRAKWNVTGLLREVSTLDDLMWACHRQPLESMR